MAQHMLQKQFLAFLSISRYNNPQSPDSRLFPASGQYFSTSHLQKTIHTPKGGTMDTMIILGAGQFGQACASLINPARTRLLAFGDNNKSLHGSNLRQVPVMSVEEAVRLQPDYALIGVTDEIRTKQLKDQAAEHGFHGRFLLLGELYRLFDIRSATLHRMADRLEQLKIPGDIAELGVYKGDLAWQLNALFPHRILHLFDTFEGFDARDIAEESHYGFSRAREGDFSDTSIPFVHGRLPYPGQALFHKGFFPETAAGLENCRYALVSLDADLYAPILAGLEYFYPRLSPGGMILLHDYNNRRFQGAARAAADYEKAHGKLPLVPLCDLHGTAVILGI